MHYGRVTDIVSKKRRSWNMSRIRAKDTKPEILVRSLLHQMGFRFRLHVRGLAGCPDIVLPRWRSLVFVHGCFWHRHATCGLAYTPKSRKAFWNKKFRDNVRRDRRAIRTLTESGWRVLVVWECEVENLPRLQNKLRIFMGKR